MDVDTRWLRSLVAVAEERHLTRAAQRLFVSQPAITKQVRKLEEAVGVPLFTRSRAGMTPTAAGEVFAARASAILADWDDAAAEAQAAAARATRVLRVGFLASAANESTREILAAFGDARPGWRVDLCQGAWSDPTAGLAAGSVDVALLRLPFPDQASWKVRVLLSEPRCVVLPTGHRLAGREAIEFRELWNEPFVAAPEETGSWRDYWLATDARDGSPPRIGAVTRFPDDWLTAIATGRGIALAPQSASRYYQRPGLLFRPVHGISHSEVGVVWRPRDDENPVVQDFVTACVDLAGGS